ncbi:MAG: hypothetical protein AB1Z98_06440 [Nannocystaceae bacterium]
MLRRLLLVVPMLAACQTEAEAPAAASSPASSPGAKALAERCRATIEHITLGIYPETARPKGGELVATNAIIAAARTRCEHEGLTEAQAACMTKGTMADGLASVRTCLGDETGWPSWFSGAGVQLP